MAATQKINWAEDVDELDEPSKPPVAVEKPLGIVEDTVDENGIRTTVEYSINDEGKRVKITRRTKRVLQKSLVDHAVAERKTWAKFGAEKGNKEGPDRATTTVGEDVRLKISAGNKSNEPEPTEQSAMKQNLARAGAGKVQCRVCKGDHFTAKCPYKDTLGMLDQSDAPPPAGDDDDGKEAAAAGAGGAAGTSTGGRYVPPSLRNRGPGERMPGGPGGPANRDDMPTLRVTNISEDVEENDLRDLFGTFGRVARVYVGRDRETGAGKGFAFVSFEDREVAKKAMDKLHGRGYDNLILSVQWSQPREQK